MKIDRSNIYRVKAKAINCINASGTKFESEELNTYYCIPVRNSRKKIITFNELLTGTPLVKRVYEKNECCDDDYYDEYYPYAYDKSRETYQVGDVDVEIDQNFETEEVLKYAEQSAEMIAENLKTLEIRAIEKTCDGFDPNQSMAYYNKQLFLCYLDDDYIIVSARRNPLGIMSGYRELHTKRKVIKHTGDDACDFDYLINLNRQLMDPEITPVNRYVLATRELTVEEFEQYMNLTPEEVEAKISIFIAKLSRKRATNYLSLGK